MTDAEVIKRWNQIKDAKEALRALLEGWQFLGYDPYYKHLHDALYAMVERCAE